jgi:hypothetical protein
MMLVSALVDPLGGFLCNKCTLVAPHRPPCTEAWDPRSLCNRVSKRAHHVYLRVTIALMFSCQVLCLYFELFCAVSMVDLYVASDWQWQSWQ